MKDVQCYELFGGIALKNHAFSFIIFNLIDYISICTDAELFILFCRIIYIYTKEIQWIRRKM